LVLLARIKPGVVGDAELNGWEHRLWCGTGIARAATKPRPQTGKE
jgi:hypothetical protein